MAHLTITELLAKYELLGGNRLRNALDAWQNTGCPFATKEAEYLTRERKAIIVEIERRIG